MVLTHSTAHQAPGGLPQRIRWFHGILDLVQLTSISVNVPLQPIADQVAAGRYKAKPAGVFRFEDISEAHRVMEANQAGGKMVVLV